MAMVVMVVITIREEQEQVSKLMKFSCAGTDVLDNKADDSAW